MTEIIERIISIATVIEIATIILVISIAVAICLYFHLSKKNKDNIRKLNKMCKGASKYLYANNKTLWEKFFSQTKRNFNWFTRISSVNHLELRRFYKQHIK